MTAFAEPTAGIPNDLYIFSGVFFGKSSMPGAEQAPLTQHQGAPICSHWANHVLIAGDTRAGKGSRVIIPTLLRYASSMLAIDPNGQGAAVTARARRALNQTVHIVNPWGVRQDTFKSYGLTGATYNPLDVLDREDPNAVTVAQDLADAICPADGPPQSTFFNRSAASLITAVLLSLADWPEEEKTPRRLREIVTKPAQDFRRNFLTRMRASEAFAGSIREHAAPLAGMPDQSFLGVMSVVAEHSAFLSDPQLKAATTSSSFSMTDLLKSPTTVYVVIPPVRMSTHQAWLRLMVSAGMQAYKRPVVPRNELHRCMFLIDDFPALGRFDELTRCIGIMPGYGADFTLVVQGLDQLEQVYGDAPAAILNNCAYKWFCSVGDRSTAEYLSAALGKPGLTPEEILTLGRDTAILLAPREKLHYLRTVDYWDLGQAFATLKSVYPHMYWEPPLKWDENPYTR